MSIVPVPIVLIYSSIFIPFHLLSSAIFVSIWDTRLFQSLKDSLFPIPLSPYNYPTKIPPFKRNARFLHPPARSGLVIPGIFRRIHPARRLWCLRLVFRQVQLLHRMSLNITPTFRPICNTHPMHRTPTPPMAL